jgi:hypothetical protein
MLEDAANKDGMANHYSGQTQPLVFVTVVMIGPPGLKVRIWPGVAVMMGPPGLNVRVGTVLARGTIRVGQGAQTVKVTVDNGEPYVLPENAHTTRRDRIELLSCMVSSRR